ncbi:MAG: polyphosphate kinase 2 family protein [Bacteroidota bacterium]|nr:polyphosphate kinase 2 family protein [Bacteroidota bacterium]MDP4197126.1 polyphosphate kinase 2 family protein [Bacteroidota bacterium]
MKLAPYIIKPGSKLNLNKLKTGDTGKYRSKEDAIEKLEDNINAMADLQGKLYAQDRLALLIVFQAMDGGGKDSSIKHVMTGLNPQGTQVTSFKQPSKEELDHDFLWRISRSLPEKGRIGIFNRSHYEEVLVVRVHNLLLQEKLPQNALKKNIWDMRFKQINSFEKYLFDTGTYIIKFFLHISKEEQKQRFLDRINDPSKNWKITEEDFKERQYWDQYQKCYEDAIKQTSKTHAPWYVIPADKKWFAHLVISEVIIKTMQSMNIQYPQITEEQKKRLQVVKQNLLSEK